MKRLLLALGAALLLASPWLMAQTDFVGADDQAAQAIEATGHEPWAAPLFEPSDRQEVLLFTLQAGLGLGLFAWVLRRRRSSSR